METLPTQFEDAIRSVTVSGNKLDLVKDAHSEVRGLLESDDQLCDWGIDTILIGSYARHTSRYPAKDVDVFLRFTSLTTDDDPRSIFEAVKQVLADEYGLKGEDPGGRVSPQKRSLKIDFDDPIVRGGDLSFSVDAVPAVPWGSNWGIPNRDIAEWSTPERRWVETNPIEFADRTDTLATAGGSPAVGDVNAYRPVVRLLRQARHIHLADQKPGGLYLEIATYDAWSEHAVFGSSWAKLTAASLEAVAARFREASELGMLDPVLGTPLEPALDPAEWRRAADAFDELASLAREALESDRCHAAKIWRDILGTNDRGQVMPLPDGCDANGFPLSKISAIDAVGSNEPRGFA